VLVSSLFTLLAEQTFLKPFVPKWSWLPGIPGQILWCLTE
jgi:hypothetical protein